MIENYDGSNFLEIRKIIFGSCRIPSEEGYN
jgi:hypothetical protein